MHGIRDTISLFDLMRSKYGPMMDTLFAKTDYPMLTTTTGVHNAIFGPRLMININQNHNALGAMHKTGWAKSGFRMKTAQSSTAGPGLDEGGDIPGSVKGTYVEVTVPAKQIGHRFNESTMMLNKAGKDDVVLWADYAQDEGETFLNRINRAILQDNNTLAALNPESIDRIIASSGEIDGVVQDAGDLDIYGLDRDSTATYDAYVSHNSNVDRSLVFTYIDEVYSAIRPYWENDYYDQGKWACTGYDTLERVQQLGFSQVRFSLQDKVEFTMGDGIKTLKGADFGYDCSSYKGVPWIPDAFVQKDTISRFYVMDGKNLFFSWLDPIHYEDIISPLTVGTFTKEGLYHAQGEVVCTKFSSQGKGRDFS